MDSSKSSESEDIEERAPKCHQATRGKQPVREELANKKKRKDTPPTRKGGGITFREPSVRQRFVAEWSDDDEDRGETL